MKPCHPTAMVCLVITLFIGQPVAAKETHTGNKHQQKQSPHKHSDDNKKPMEHMQHREHMQKMHPAHAVATSPAVGQIQIGGYFSGPQVNAAKIYFDQTENKGFCPPGLAKKGAGCLPPGQRKQWTKGQILPPGVVFYDVPRSLVVTLGAPPPGYKYVRIASDILLIAIGSQMVIDAMEDLVH
jgi:Ni/Co efflux regulator RcnB